MAALDDATRDEVIRDMLSMIGQLASTLGTVKELIDNLHGRVSALERTNIASMKLRGTGQLVRRIDDDSPTPTAGTVILSTSPREWVWVLWDGAAVPVREAHDELMGLDP